MLQREQLLKPLQLVLGAVDQKQAMPILSNVLLDFDPQRLSVTGTDLEIELIGQSAFSQAGGTEGRMTLPARKLFDICKALPENAPIELYHDKDRVILTSDRSRFVIATLSPDNFPSVELLAANVMLTVSQREFATILHRTAFAMAQQDVRYYLNGMLLEVSDGVLRVVATDGHRLALNEMPISTVLSATDKDKLAQVGLLQVILPYRAVIELMRLLHDPEKDLTLNIGHNHFRVLSEDFTFTTKLIEGRYPDYQRVIPKMGQIQITADRDQLKQALQRTAILCHDKVRGVRIELQKNCLKLSANNPEHEMAEEELAVNYLGESLDLAFNITYLLDVLAVVKPGPVQLVLTDTTTSMRMEEPDSAARSVFVIMPMRL